ncbi:hypothetical protein Hanom_Chr11g01043231 [Helianthus anomalus]
MYPFFGVSVPVYSVHYRFGTIPILYRILHTNTGIGSVIGAVSVFSILVSYRTEHFRYWYPYLAIFGTGIFGIVLSVPVPVPSSSLIRSVKK